MSERSVAEIIGWVIEDNPWYNERTAYREEPKRLRANGEYWLTSKRPTVDDLLAWLRGQGYDVTTKVMRFASSGAECPRRARASAARSAPLRR